MIVFHELLLGLPAGFGLGLKRTAVLPSVAAREGVGEVARVGGGRWGKGENGWDWCGLWLVIVCGKLDVC